MRVFKYMIIATIVAIGCGMIGAPATSAAPAAKSVDSPIVAKCKADLAKRLKLPATGIKTIEMQATTWPDASMGMPEIGKVYAQVETPGFRIILDAKNTAYLYTASTKAFKYGGPVSVWAYSMLYTKPVMSEPNLNGDLYQCSLTGTNSLKVISRVTDYYPQQNGVVIIKRRTSRSGHELLYVKIDDASQSKTLRSGFDFGATVLNSTQDQWAGFVRPRISNVWNVVVSPVGENSPDAQVLPLPVDVGPGKIAWSGDKLMIVSKKGDAQVAYEISPKAATPEWKSVGVHTFPRMPDYMLNKSETLVISRTADGNKPVVVVAREWFNGDRKVIARISDFTMRGSDFLGGRYAFVWGEKASKPAAYTVDIVTGEVIPSFSGEGGNIKPFVYPPLQNPLVLNNP